MTPIQNLTTLTFNKNTNIELIGSTKKNLELKILRGFFEAYEYDFFTPVQSGYLNIKDDNQKEIACFQISRYDTYQTIGANILTAILMGKNVEKVDINKIVAFCSRRLLSDYGNWLQNGYPTKTGTVDEDVWLPAFAKQLRRDSDKLISAIDASKEKSPWKAFSVRG